MIPYSADIGGLGGTCHDYVRFIGEGGTDEEYDAMVKYQNHTLFSILRGNQATTQSELDTLIIRFVRNVATHLHDTTCRCSHGRSSRSQCLWEYEKGTKNPWAETIHQIYIRYALIEINKRGQRVEKYITRSYKCNPRVGDVI